MIVKIPKSLLNNLIKLALKMGKKEELAGVLLGTIDKDIINVKTYKTLENILHSPTRFEINPEEFYQVIIYGEKMGYEIVGLWHTHPSPPQPSLIDLKYMELWPVLWLIISSINGSYAAYILREGELKKVKIEKI